jgi:hypothetical protein
VCAVEAFGWWSVNSDDPIIAPRSERLPLRNGHDALGR